MHVSPVNAGAAVMIEGFVCWKCGGSLIDVLVPLSRRQECPSCATELHVCRMCEFYEPRVAGSCREDRAEEVRDKEHANFCDFFEPKPDAYQPRDNAATQTAMAELEALFNDSSAIGEPGSDSNDARKQLDALFGSDDGK